MSGVIDYIRNLRKVAKPGAEDASDRLNFVWTPVLLVLCSLVVFGKEYVARPMYCVFSGQNHPSGFDDFAESYCWAYGTYAYSREAEVQLTGFSDLAQQEQYWKSLVSQKQGYYQWVPFLLLLQCVLTYMPKIIWQLICSQRFGSDIYSLIGLAAESKTSDRRSFNEQAARIADVVERMLVYNREFRSGRFHRLKSAVYARCSFLMPSKRMGTMLTVLYIFVKLLCLANAIGQHFLMAVFLGFWHRGADTYGWAMLQSLRHLISGRDRQEAKLFFPLRTLCYVTFELDVGTRNSHVGQCTLPVNIINEKIFIVLFLWFSLLGLATLVSIGRWLCRLLCSCNRVSFIKRFLRLSDPRLKMDKTTVKLFISKFLRHDGVFLLLMLSEGSDKVITTEVVRLLHWRWRENHQSCDLGQLRATAPPAAAAAAAAVGSFCGPCSSSGSDHDVSGGGGAHQLKVPLADAGDLEDESGLVCGV